MANTLLIRMDKIVTPCLMPFLSKKTKRLVLRRQGYLAHLKLEKRFKEIRRGVT